VVSITTKSHEKASFANYKSEYFTALQIDFLVNVW